MDIKKACIAIALTVPMTLSSCGNPATQNEEELIPFISTDYNAVIEMIDKISVADLTTEKFADEISKIDTQDLTATAEKLKEIHREFKKAEKIISITVSHDDLTNIEESFADMIGAAEAKMETNVITAKSRLEDALRHLGRLSSINLDSII